MTDANVGNTERFPMTSPRNSSHDKYSEYLIRGESYHPERIHNRLFDYNPLYVLLLSYLVRHMRKDSKKDYLSAIQVEVPSTFTNGAIGQHLSRQMLKDYVGFGLLIRYNNRSNVYYVNPNMYHMLTVSQRNEYGDSYPSMFPEITIP